MSNLEVIDRLCSVTTKLSDIVRKQAAFIEEQLAVDEEVKRSFQALRDEADNELDIIEFDLRRERG